MSIEESKGDSPELKEKPESEKSPTEKIEDRPHSDSMTKGTESWRAKFTMSGA